MFLVGPHTFQNRPENGNAVELHPAIAEVLAVAERAGDTKDFKNVLDVAADFLAAAKALKAARTTWEVRT